MPIRNCFYFVLLTSVLRTDPLQAELTSKERGLITVGGGCAGGMGLGLVIDYFDTAPYKSTLATVMTNTVIGCISGGLVSYFFQDDTQKASSKGKNRSDDIDPLGKTNSFSTSNRPEMKYPEVPGLSGNSVPEDFDFDGLREPGCLARKFTLSGDDDSQYIPVSPYVIIPKGPYFVLHSKDDRPCVRGLGTSKDAYLEDEVPDLGNYLLNRGADKKATGKKKKRTIRINGVPYEN